MLTLAIFAVLLVLLMIDVPIAVAIGLTARQRPLDDVQLARFSAHHGTHHLGHL